MSKNKIYQLPYHEDFDKDIDTWLKGLPRSRKAEMVRSALRFYIATTSNGFQPNLVIPTQQPQKQEEPTKPKRKGSLTKLDI